MQSRDQTDQIDCERISIRAAAQRLFNGTPTRSNGKHSISSLAVEAAISRQRLYEHHADLIAEFKATTNCTTTTPESIALKNQLDHALTRIATLEASEIQLLAQIRTLRSVITELTHEAEASNVVRLKPG